MCFVAPERPPQMALRAVVEMQVVGEFTSPVLKPRARRFERRRSAASRLSITGARTDLREGLRNAPLL